MTYQVIFQPSGSRGKIEAEQSLLDAARTLSVELESVCGGAGVCGKCKVKIMEGYFTRYDVFSTQDHLTPLTSEEIELLEEEERKEGFRLACMSRIQGDLVIYIPPEVERAKQLILEEGKEREFNLRPSVEGVYQELPAPTLQDNRGDAERLKEPLAEERGLNLFIDYAVLQELPGVLRVENFHVLTDIWQEKEIVRVMPAQKTRPRRYGLAVDIGTTTVAAYLCDLDSGETRAQASDVNAQVSLARILSPV